MSTYWKIYCVDEDGWQYQWANDSLTVCPNDSNHEVRSTVELEKSMILASIPIYKSTSNTYKTRLKNFVYNGGNGSPTMRLVKGIAYKSGTMTSFTLTILDATNQTTLLSATVTNTDDSQLLELGTVSNAPTTECILEVHVTMNGGNSSSIINVDEILFYS